MAFRILSNNLNTETLDEDPVSKEFDILDSEVSSFTENRASIKFIAMSDDEAKVYFERPDVESYWVDLKYSLMDGDVEHRYRNRFAFISYNGSFPVQFGSPLLENKSVQTINDVEHLQEAIIEVATEKSFERSLLRARRGTR